MNTKQKELIDEETESLEEFFEGLYEEPDNPIISYKIGKYYEQLYGKDYTILDGDFYPDEQGREMYWIEIFGDDANIEHKGYTEDIERWWKIYQRRKKILKLRK
jgi:hypothetical protein